MYYLNMKKLLVNMLFIKVNIKLNIIANIKVHLHSTKKCLVLQNYKQ